MYIDNVTTYRNRVQNYGVNRDKQAKDFVNTLKSKIGQIDKAPNAQGEKRLVGRMIMIPAGINNFKCLTLKYAEDSTEQDPIMVSSEGDRVHINDVDPSDATELEMAMYCAHLDSTGRGTGSTFGTYKDLKLARMMASHNGMINADQITSADDLRSVKRNWTKFTKELLDMLGENDRAKKEFDIINRMLDAIEGYGGNK